MQEPGSRSSGPRENAIRRHEVAERRAVPVIPGWDFVLSGSPVSAGHELKTNAINCLHAFSRLNTRMQASLFFELRRTFSTDFEINS